MLALPFTRVFMFMDPELLSEAVCRALVAEIKAAQISQCARSCMLHVIERALPAVLKDRCNVGNLQDVLKVREIWRSCCEALVSQILSGQLISCPTVRNRGPNPIPCHQH